MPNIKLPDGKKIYFPEAVNGLQIANKIGTALWKDDLVLEVNGR